MGKLGDGMHFSLPQASSSSIKDSAHIKSRNEHLDKESHHQGQPPQSMLREHLHVPGTGLRALQVLTH